MLNKTSYQIIQHIQVAAISAAVTFYSGVAGSQITPSNPANTQVNVVNGVDVVDIAAPSASGVSQNQFDDFNVSTTGVVINNSLVNGNSNRAGPVNANANFSGNSARIILNEVITTNPSNLQGATEIFGDNASYILSNPNGITCDGCGFFRTPTATGDTGNTLIESILTTGAATVDAGGIPLSLTVDTSSTASIIVGPGGLDSNNVDATTLLTRQTQIQGAISTAGQLHILAGTGTLDIESGVAPEDRNFTATQPGDGAVSLAIDASITGAMNAGQIYIMATEDGVGVSLDSDLISTDGDIEITAEGEIRYRNANADDNLSITTNDSGANIIASGNSTAGQNINWNTAGNAETISATPVTLSAGDDIAITCSTPPCQFNAQTDTTFNADNLQSNAAINSTAGNDLNINASVNSSAAIQSGADLSITASSGNISASSLSATDNINLRTEQNNATVNSANISTTNGDINWDINNNATINGQLTAGDDVDIDCIGANCQLNSNNSLQIVADELQGDADIVTAANQDLTVNVNSVNRDGDLRSGNDLAVTAANGNIRAGDLQAENELTLRTELANATVTANRIAAINGNINWQLTELSQLNVATNLTAGNNINFSCITATICAISGSSDLNLNANQLITAGDISTQAGRDLSINANLNTTANFQSGDDLTIITDNGDLIAGQLSAADDISLRTELADANVQVQSLNANGDLRWTLNGSGELINSSSNVISAGDAVVFDCTTPGSCEVTGGTGALSITADTLGGDATLRSISGQDITINAAINRTGDINSGNDLAVNTTGNVNSGLLNADNALIVNAAAINSSNISSGNTVSLTASNGDINVNQVNATNLIQLRTEQAGATLNTNSTSNNGDIVWQLNGNSQLSGQYNAGNNMQLQCIPPQQCAINSNTGFDITANTLITEANLSTSAGSDLILNAGIDTDADIQSAGRLVINASSGDINSRGLLQAAQDIELSSATNHNLILDGTVRSGGNLSLLGDGNYIHDAVGQYDIGGDWIIDSFAMTNNTTLSVADLRNSTLRVNELTNNGLIQSDTALTLNVDDVLNNNGVITSLEGIVRIRNSNSGEAVGTINNNGIISAINLSQNQQPDFDLIIDPQSLVDQHIAAILNGEQRSANDLANDIELANQQALSELTVDTNVLGALEIQANVINNSLNGSITANELLLEVQDLNNDGGLIAAANNLSITGDNVNNRNANDEFGIITARNNIDIDLTNQLFNQGIIESTDISIDAPTQINDSSGLVIESLAGQSLNSQGLIDAVGQQPWFSVSGGSDIYYQYIQAFDNNPLVVSNLSRLTDQFLIDADAELNGIPIVGDDVYMATLLAETIGDMGGLPFATEDRNTLIQLNTLYNNTLDYMQRTGLSFAEMPSVSQRLQLDKPILVFSSETLPNNQVVYAPSILIPEQGVNSNQLQAQQLNTQIIAYNELLLRSEQLNNSASLIGGNKLNIETVDLTQTTTERNWYVDADGNVQYQSASMESEQLALNIEGNYVQEGGQVVSNAPIAIEANNIEIRGAEINQRIVYAEVKTLTESDSLYMMARERANIGNGVKLRTSGEAFIQAAEDLRFDGDVEAQGVSLLASNIQLGGNNNGPRISSQGNINIQADNNIALSYADIRASATTGLNNENEDGAAAGDITILAAQGDINSSNSSLQSDNRTVMQAGGNLRNQNIAINAVDISLITAKDQDFSGTLQADQDIALQAGNNLAIENALANANNIIAIAEQGDFSNRNMQLNSTEQVFLQAGGNLDSINARINSGTDTTLMAGNNQSFGGTIDSSGNAILQAGNNLSLDQATLNSQGDIMTVAENGDLTNRATTLRANSLLQQAGGNIASNSSSFTSLDGDITQIAGKSISDNGSDFAAQGDIALQAQQDITLERSALLANNNAEQGGNILLMAESGSINSKARQFNGQQSVFMQAGKDINNQNTLITAGAGGLAQIADGNITNRNNRLESGGDILQQAGGTLTLDKVMFNSAEDTLLIAKNNINANNSQFNAGNISWLSESGSINSNNDQLRSQGNITLQADNNINLRSADFLAQKTAEEDTGSLNLIATKGNIVNDAGSLRAENSIFMQAGNDIINRSRQTVVNNKTAQNSQQYQVTVKNHNQNPYQRYYSGNRSYTGKRDITTRSQRVVTEEAIIQAGDGGVTQIAGNDIQNLGATIRSQGDIYQKAEGSILNKTLTKNYLQKQTTVKTHPAYGLYSGWGNFISKSRGGNSRTSSQTGVAVQSASLSATGNIIQNAGGSIRNLGARINAGDNIVQEAKGNIENRSLLARTSTSRTLPGFFKIKAHNSKQHLITGTMQAGGSIVSKADGDVINTGNLRAGEDITLSGRDIKNTRLSIAAKNTSRRSGNTSVYTSGRRQVLNTGKLDAGGSITLNASRDIVDTAGRYNAGEDINLIAGRDIKQRALTWTEKDRVSRSYTYNRFNFFGGGSSSYTHTYNVGSNSRTRSVLGSLDAGGSVNISADRDVSLAATDIDAGSNISISGRHITLDAIKNKTASNRHEGRTVRRSHKITHQVTDLKAGDSIAIQAKGDFTAKGSNIRAGDDANDNIIINATGKTNLDSVHNETYSYYRRTKKRSFGRRKTTTKEDLSIKAQGTNIAGGGSLLMNIGVDEDGNIEKLRSDDINFDGSNVNMGGDTLIYSDGDVNVFAALEYEYHKHRTKKRGFLGLSSSDRGSISREQILKATDLKTRRGDLSLISDDNINVIASNLESGGDINLQAYNNVLIAAGQQLKEYDEWDVSSGFFKGGNFYELEENRSGNTTNEFIASSIFAGNNININAGRAKIIGSDLIAGNQINAITDVGDIEILAAGSSEDSYEYSKSITVSFGDLLEGMTDIGGTIDDLKESGQLKLTLAKATYDEVDSQTDTVTNQGSFLQANNGVNLEAAGDINIVGSTLLADADEDNIGDLNLLAGGNINIQEAIDRFDNTTEEVHGEAELSFVVQNEYDQVVRTAIALDEAVDNLKQAKEDYRQYQKDLKKYKANLAKLEEAYDNKEPGISYADIVELREIIDDAESDEAWYQAGIAAAALDVTSKTTALAQQTASAAASTATYGFNAGIQLDISATKTQTETNQTLSVASVLDGNNIILRTGNGGQLDGTSTLVQGSHLNAKNNLTIETGQLDIRASKDTWQSETNTEDASISISQTVYGAAGGPTISGSYGRSQNKDKTTTYNNSTLNAANINITTAGDTNIQGGNIRASDKLTANIGGNLLVESMQNRSSGSNKSFGISGGVSLGGPKGGNKGNKASTAHQNFGTNGKVDSVNGGINAGQGRYRSRETVLSSLTSGGTADITVNGHTQVNGALVATVDDDGNDLGQLNLSTTTFGFEDLSNTSYSSDVSGGLNTSINVNGSGPTVGNTSIQYSNNSSYDKSKTLATIGQGNLTIKDKANSTPIERLNRDTLNTERDIYSVDRQQGNIDVTIDTRLLTQEGRQQIKNDFIDSYEFGEDIFRAASTLNKDDQLGLLNFWSALHNNAQATQLKNDLLRNPENAHILEGLKSGDGDKYAQAMANLGHLAQEKFDLELTDINLYDATKTTSTSLQDNLFLDRRGGTVADANHSEYGNIYIDANADKTDHVNTLGQEVIESQTLQTGGKNDSKQEALSIAFGNQFESRINQAAGGDLNSTGGSNFRNNLLQSESVFKGTQRANTVGNARVHHRQFYTREAQLLDQARVNISNSGLSKDEKEVALLQLNAVACAEVRCANGVSDEDPLYEQLKKLQDLGDNLKGQDLELSTMLGQAVPEDQFEYGWQDRFQDVVTRNEEAIERTKGATNMVIGGVGTAISGTATVVSAPACTTVVGCAVPVGLGALTTLTAVQAADGAATLFGSYTNTEGKRVLDSFSEGTHPGNYNVFTSGAMNTGLWVAETVALNKVSKVIPKSVKDKAGDLITGRSGNKNTDTDVPEVVIRFDDDFLAKTNSKGQKKSYIDDNGDLKPANTEGSTTIQQHVRGGSKKDDSPYTSTTDPKYSGNPKEYGDNQISINTRQLQKDINSGKVKDTEIVTPKRVQAELQNKVDTAQKRYDANPTKNNERRLKDAERDLTHAKRDNECLIKGCVPSKYIKRSNK